MLLLKNALLGFLLAGFAAAGMAQDAKPYKEGPVVEVTYVKIKPGKFDDYMKHLSTQYKTLMEANKKAGLITAYAIYSNQARSPQDPDLILTITYPNMAALDKIDEGEAVAAKVVGPTAVQNKEYAARESMREVLGGQLIRELILK
jgi:L-rhamnose mutarotase